MKKYSLLLLVVLFFCSVFAQEEKKEEFENGYEFEMIKEIPHTSVKSQDRTGTCWSWSATSMFESELMRMGKGKHELAPMFSVYYSYLGKANRYVRLKNSGVANFPSGGALNDVRDVWERFGMVPMEVFDGLNYGSEKHNHSELQRVLKGFLDNTSTKKMYDKRKKKWADKAYVSSMWKKGMVSLLNTWLGEIPEKFEYKGKTYSPKSFAKELGINPSDYVLLSSFNHVPFYETFVIEVPDNWSQERVYNVPLNEFTEIMEYAVMNGYSFSWASDLGDKYTAYNGGIWMIPEKDISKWDRKKKKQECFKEPLPQKKITQEFRQKGYDNFDTTDDHGMHIVGLAKDQDGRKFYYIKNSWGTEDKMYDGYQYVSEEFVQYKTTSIMLHKNAIPKHIREKLGL